MKKELLERADETDETTSVNIEEIAQYISMRTNIRFDIALLYLELSEKYLDGSQVYDELECCNYVCKNTDNISLEDFFLLSRAEIQFFFDNGDVEHIKKIDFENITEREIKTFIKVYNSRFSTITQ